MTFRTKSTAWRPAWPRSGARWQALPDQIEEIASAGRRRLGRATDDVTERAKDGVDALEGEIGAHPLVAVGLAFLVGMAFDRFLLR